jgi:hypothetical protein
MAMTKKNSNGKEVKANARKMIAARLEKEALHLIAGVEKAWVRIGQVCLEVRKSGYHVELGFKTFREWMEERIGQRKSQIYMAMSALRELENDFTKKEIAEMTLSNASLMAKVPKSKRRKLLKHAQKQTEKDFRKTIDKEAPGMAIERKGHLEWWLEQSAIAVIERGIEKAKEIENTDSQTVALEAIFTHYLECPDVQVSDERPAASVAAAIQ